MQRHGNNEFLHLDAKDCPTNPKTSIKSLTGYLNFSGSKNEADRRLDQSAMLPLLSTDLILMKYTLPLMSSGGEIASLLLAASASNMPFKNPNNNAMYKDSWFDSFACIGVARVA